MSYSADQINALALTERVASVFSLIGCAFVIFTFIFSARFRKPVNRLILYAVFGNVGYAVGTLISTAGLQQGSDSPLCQAQAFFIQAWLPADALWNLSMAMNVYVTVFKHYDTSQLRAREPWYHLINYGLPFTVALAYCFISTPTNGKIYGNAVIWCWITEKWDYLRIATCYGPAWICIIASFTIYVLAGIEIRKKRKELKRVRVGDSNSRRTTEVQVVSELADLGSSNRTTLSEPPKSPRETRPSHVNFGSEYSVSVRGGGNFDIVEATNGPSRARQRNSALEANTAAWRYTKSCVLFFASLLVTWLPSSVNRVYALVWPDLVPPYGLSYVASLVLPLTGFWNSIIYVTTSWSACKALWGEDIAPLFCQRNSHQQIPDSGFWASGSRPTIHRSEVSSPQPQSWTGGSRKTEFDIKGGGGRNSPADSLAGFGRAL